MDKYTFINDGESFGVTVGSATSHVLHLLCSASMMRGQRARHKEFQRGNKNPKSLQALLPFTGDLPLGGPGAYQHTVQLPPPLWPEQDAPERAGDPAKRVAHKTKRLLSTISPKLRAQAGRGEHNSLCHAGWGQALHRCGEIFVQSRPRGFQDRGVIY